MRNASKMKQFRKGKGYTQQEMADALEMARDAIGLKGNGSYKNNQSNCKDVHLKCNHNVRILVKELLESWLWTYGRNESSQVHNFG